MVAAGWEQGHKFTAALMLAAWLGAVGYGELHKVPDRPTAGASGGSGGTSVFGGGEYERSLSEDD